jgi:hypothetical protein
MIVYLCKYACGGCGIEWSLACDNRLEGIIRHFIHKKEVFATLSDPEQTLHVPGETRRSGEERA